MTVSLALLCQRVDEPPEPRKADPRASASCADLFPARKKKEEVRRSCCRSVLQGVSFLVGSRREKRCRRQLGREDASWPAALVPWPRLARHLHSASHLHHYFSRRLVRSCVSSLFSRLCSTDACQRRHLTRPPQMTHIYRDYGFREFVCTINGVHAFMSVRRVNTSLTFSCSANLPDAYVHEA